MLDHVSAGWVWLGQISSGYTGYVMIGQVRHC